MHSVRERERERPYTHIPHCYCFSRLSIKLFRQAAFSEQCTTYKASFVRVNVIISILLLRYSWNGFVCYTRRGRQQWTFVVMIFLKSLELLLFANSSLPALVPSPLCNGIVQYATQCWIDTNHACSWYWHFKRNRLFHCWLCETK